MMEPCNVTGFSRTRVAAEDNDPSVLSMSISRAGLHRAQATELLHVHGTTYTRVSNLI